MIGKDTFCKFRITTKTCSPSSTFFQNIMIRRFENLIRLSLFLTQIAGRICFVMILSLGHEKLLAVMHSSIHIL